MIHDPAPPADLHEPAAGVTVVFLHHFGGSSRTATEVIEHLGGLRCLPLNLPGSGGTPVGREPLTVSGMADFVCGKMAQTDVPAAKKRRFVLVGHSMGGKVAMLVASRKPEGLAGLVLLAPSPPTPEPMTDAGRDNLLKANGDARIARGIVDDITAADLSEATKNQAVADMRRVAPEAWRAWPTVGSQEDVAAGVGTLDLPAAVVVGDGDPVISEALARSETLPHLTNARLHVVPGSGHLLPLEAPAAVARVVRAMCRVAATRPLAGVPSLQPAPATVDDALAIEPDAAKILRLIASDYTTPPTRTALLDRIVKPAVTEPKYFDAATYATLRSACDRLIPQPDRRRPIDLAGPVDARLAAGRGDGWRYDSQPPDGEAYKVGLAALDEASRSRHGLRFADATAVQQDAMLGEAKGGRFFEDLLAEVAEVHFAHPLAQQEMDYAGLADAKGWDGVQIGDPAEPVAVLHGE